MSRFLRGVLVTAALASLVTLVIAWPVVRNPTEQIYGREILGRTSDPYSFIYQFAAPDVKHHGPWEPLSSGTGGALSRVLPPVAAYNVLVLLTFPLSAMTAYALAWYLMRSHAGALVAALAYAFSPAHLAHAAYHPQITQTQWMPLYVLALIALVDRLSLPRALGLAAAVLAVALSSLDSGLIGVTMAPAVLAGFWAIRSDANRNIRPLLAAALVLLVILAAGGATVWALQPDLLAMAREYSVPLGVIGFYRGRWWAYLTPPVDHPWLGGLARRVLSAAQINLQLTEMQLYLGYALLALSLAALGASIVRWKSEPRWRFVPAAIFTGLVAVLISLGPTSGACEPASTAPACLIFNVAPMFFAYARFGLVAQLMLSLAAGAGAALLLGTPVRRRLAIALLAVAVFEYWPLPARAHDVLPTSAHRWLAASPDEGRILDCYPGTATQIAIPWLMQRDVTFLGSTVVSCSDPQIGLKLAGTNVTQVLVRHGNAASKLPSPLPPGITPLREFFDADLYAVSAELPPVVTLQTTGFFGYERNGDDWWQWMGPAGRWTVRNTTTQAQTVTLSVDLLSIGAPRRLTVKMDEGEAAAVDVGLTAQEVTLGPWTLAPGLHALDFVADGDPIRPSDTDSASTDRRPLTISFRRERWSPGASAEP